MFNYKQFLIENLDKHTQELKAAMGIEDCINGLDAYNTIKERFRLQNKITPVSEKSIVDEVFDNLDNKR